MIIARRMSILLVCCAALASSGTSYAACNLIPSSSFEAAPLFHSTRGATQSPFLIPEERLLVARRTCDDGTALSDVADARVVVMLQPPAGKTRALVLKKGTDGPCTSADTFTAGCDNALSGAGGATCLSVDDYTLQGGVVDLELPVPNPMAAPIRVTSGRVTVAVANQSDDGEKLCAALAKYEGGCKSAIAEVPELHACIDSFVTPGADTDECQSMGRHPTFLHPTLLPLPNDAHAVCGKEIKGDFCAIPISTPASEIRYAAESERSLLVPINWQKSVDSCPEGCGRLKVTGELMPPNRLDFPDNLTAYPSRNHWLRSYTYDGKVNDPEFAKLDPSGAGTRAFWGTVDEPTSVLRFESRLMMCRGTLDGCEQASSCTSGTCETRCASDHTRSCSTNSTCPNNSSCGKGLDFTQAFSGGRWRLDREFPRSFCEDDVATACTSTPCDSGSACVSYLLSLGECDCSDVRPMAVVPPAVPAPVVAPLANALGLAPDDLVASAQSEDWLAVIAPSTATGRAPALPESCRRTAGPRLLAIAKKSECTAAACSPVCPDVGPGALRDNLMLIGSQARFLQDPPVAAKPQGWLNGIAAWFRRTFGRAQTATPADTSTLTSFRLVDGRHPTVLTTVSNVVTSNAAYDPLGASSSGTTKLLVKAGRCVRDGRVLGMPSFCRPERIDECPAWSSCQPDEIVMVADLSIDHDDDGIPDRLDAVTTPASRRVP